MQGWESAIYTLSVQRHQPHKTNPQKERRERENSRIQKGNEKKAYVNNKALDLLQKPASPTPSNTESARSLYRGTERLPNIAHRELGG